MMINTLCFSLWGDYGHFKKYYTTTSPLTFEFPPPPTIIGMISAIIGLEKDDYLHHFQNPDEYRIGISITRPIKKVRWTQNLIDTKRHFWKIHNRTQIRTEFLKNPEYKIYFYHSDESIYKRLKENLENHHSVYSISLGLSELLGDFSFSGEQVLTEIMFDSWQKVDSVIPVSQLIDDQSIEFNYENEVFKVNYPVHMTPERIVEKREDVIFERNGKGIRCKVRSCFQNESGETIVFF